VAKSPIDSIIEQYGSAAGNLRKGLSIQQDANPEPRASSPSKSMAPPADLLPLFTESSAKHGVPVNVLAALAQQESGYDSKAIGAPTKWGRAKGGMQYIDDTANSLGINPFDFGQSIDAAARQFKERMANGYSVEEAIAAHHGGDDRQQWGPKTKQYVSDVMTKAGTIGELMSKNAPQNAAPATASFEDLQAELDAKEPGRFKVVTQEEADRWGARGDLMQNGIPMADATSIPQQAAPSPLTVQNQKAAQAASSAPSPLTPENQARVAAGIEPKDTRPYQGFVDATGASLANVPERFQQSLAGLVQMAGEDLGAERERFIADRAAQYGVTPGDMKLLAWAGNNKLVDPKTPAPEALKFVKQNIAQSLNPEQLKQLSAAGIVNPDEITTYGKDWRAETQKTMAEVRPEPGSAAYYGSAAIGSLAEMAPMIATAIVTRSPKVAMGVMGSQVGGQAYATGREKGLGIEEAQTYALLTAAAEAAPEALVVGQLLKPGAGIIKKALEGSVLEGAKEAVTSALQAGIDKGYISPDMTLGDARV